MNHSVYIYNIYLFIHMYRGIFIFPPYPIFYLFQDGFKCFLVPLTRWWPPSTKALGEQSLFPEARRVPRTGGSEEHLPDMAHVGLYIGIMLRPRI